MSLQLAAQHLQQHGRNGDSMLVHMSPKEVKSLSDLAMAHGGQLTINPHTGLPEAGFLSSILPMVAGVALNAFAPGLGAMGSGLLVGGLTGVATGSLSKGLMAGLGAYGGAGLGGALAEAGMQAAPEVASAQEALAAQQTAMRNAALNGGFTSAGLPANEATQQIMNSANAASQGVGSALEKVQSAYDSGSFMDKLGTMGQGIKTLGTGEGWSKLSTAAGGPMSLAKYGISAAAPALDEARQTEAPKPQTDSDMGQRYTYSPNKVEGPYTASPTGIEQRYFNPQYTAISNDQAKNIFGFADGGRVPAPGEPTKYSYDPLGQMFNKIESMPSDDQTRQASEKRAMQGGGGKPNSSPGSENPSTQSTSDAIASGLTSYGTLGFMPGSTVAGMLGQAMIGSALANAATNGGYTGTFTGDAAFGGRANNTASEGQSGPISGAAFNNSEGGGHGLGVNAGNNGSSNSSGTTAAMGGGFGSGGGDARGGYVANHRFDQRHLAMADGGPVQSFGDLEYQNTGVEKMAMGGLSDAHYSLGSYSDGGRLLRGPGDGVSDSIPATIGHKQPARLADGEFVVPARIVSELGNGSTEAGARKLYAMMDRVQAARSKTIGKGKVAKNSKAEQYLPA